MPCYNPGMKMNPIKAFFLVLVVLCLASSGDCIASGENTVSIRTDGSEATFRVEVADTPDMLYRGLMYRDHLDEDKGMLFILTEGQQRSFWMKDTTIPLDIIFADREGRILGVVTMRPCKKDPCPVYPAPEASRFALEINSGLAEKHGIGIGNSMIFHFELPGD